MGMTENHIAIGNLERRVNALEKVVIALIERLDEKLDVLVSRIESFDERIESLEEGKT